MRFVVVADLLCTLIGLGYIYDRNSSVPPSSRPRSNGAATLVKASGTVEAVASVDVSSQLWRIAEVPVSFNESRNGRAAHRAKSIKRSWSPSKSLYRGNKRNFLKLPTRFVRGDVRDHIGSLKNDHRPSYRQTQK